MHLSKTALHASGDKKSFFFNLTTFLTVILVLLKGAYFCFEGALKQLLHSCYAQAITVINR